MGDAGRTPLGSDPRHIDVVASVIGDMGLLSETELKELAADARERRVGLLDAAREKELIPVELEAFVERAVAALIDARAKEAASSAAPEGATLTSPPTGSKRIRPSSRRYVPKRLRSREEIPDVDISSLKKELQIGGSRADEAARADAEEAAVRRSREELAERFIRRIMPTMLHYTCLGRAIRRREKPISASWLARDAGCDAKDAARILVHWRSCGLLRQETTGLAEYVLSPDKEHESMFREVRQLIDDPDWHSRILAWVLDEETRGK